MGHLKGLAGGPLHDSIGGGCANVWSCRRCKRTVIGRLSRGYRQRVAVAQALLNNPRSSFWMSQRTGLDPRQIIEIRRTHRTLASTQTILVTSHILSEWRKWHTVWLFWLNGRLLGVHVLGESVTAPHLRLTIRGHLSARVQACALAVSRGGQHHSGGDPR